MSVEQETSDLSIERWDFRTAIKLGHPEMGELGIFVDVAVFRCKGEIIRVRKVKQLNIEWERFRRDDAYAGGIFQAVEALMVLTP